MQPRLARLDDVRLFRHGVGEHRASRGAAYFFAFAAWIGYAVIAAFKEDFVMRM